MRVSARTPPPERDRFALHNLHRFGSFLNCLSWKNNCSPAVKTNSLPQSMHLRILSTNSMDTLAFAPMRIQLTRDGSRTNINYFAKKWGPAAGTRHFVKCRQRVPATTRKNVSGGLTQRKGGTAGQPLPDGY